MRYVPAIILIAVVLCLLAVPAATADDTPLANIKPMDKGSYKIDEDITFEAEDRGNITYIWNFDDESEMVFGRVVEHNYTYYGTYHVVLVCIDKNGTWDNDTVTIKVVGMFGDQNILVRVLMLGICFLPLIIPALVLLFFAYVTQQVLKSFKKEFTLKILMLGLMLFICALIWTVVSLFTFCIPLAFLCANVACGAILWIATGYLSVPVTAWVIKILSKMKTFNLKKGLCLIRKPLPIPEVQAGNKTKLDTKSYLEFALEMSIYPLFMTFFLMSFITGDIEQPRDFFNGMNIFILLFAPLVTFIIVPIQILLDSNLVFVRKDKRTGVLIVYLGASLKDLFQGLIGVGAVISFVKVFLTVGSGGEIEQFTVALLLMMLIIPIIYPGLFLVVLLYTYFHNRLVRKLNDRLDKIILREYKIKEHREDSCYLAVVPLRHDSHPLEDVQRQMDQPEPKEVPFLHVPDTHKMQGPYRPPPPPKDR